MGNNGVPSSVELQQQNPPSNCPHTMNHQGAAVYAAGGGSGFTHGNSFVGQAATHAIGGVSAFTGGSGAFMGGPACPTLRPQSLGPMAPTGVCANAAGQMTGFMPSNPLMMNPQVQTVGLGMAPMAVVGCDPGGRKAEELGMGPGAQPPHGGS